MDSLRKIHFSGNSSMKKAFYLLFIVITMIYASDEVSGYLKKQNEGIKSLKKQEQQGIEQQWLEFRKYTYKSSVEFNAWHASRKKELQKFKKQIKKSWGEYIEPSNKVWVEYSKDNTSLASVNFEKGKATISVLVNTGASKEKIKEKIEKVLTRAITSKGSNDYKPVEVEKTKQRFSQPILEKQVIDNEGNDIGVIGVSRFAQGLVQEAKTTKRDGKLKIEVNFNLAPDHLQKRIERFLPLIKKYCIKYDCNLARVLATIHTESQFNPMAISSANAIGLMQLVPIYGGREAYNHVYGIDAIPKEDFLYDPERNIELGCAYIHLLKNKYFSSVNNVTKQRYCTIAAYNTGPKNVAYAFTGGRSVGGAVPVINKMESPQKVYNHLIQELPYAETRHYLAEVTERMKLYK